MLRTFETCRSDTVGTFADLFRSTLAVLCLCTIAQRLLSKSITVSPFRALVVTAQPVRVIARDTLRLAVLRTSNASGAHTIAGAGTSLVIATDGICDARSRHRLNPPKGIAVGPMSALRLIKKETVVTGGASSRSACAANTFCCNTVGTCALPKVTTSRVGCFSASNMQYPALAVAISVRFAHVTV